MRRISLAVMLLMLALSIIAICISNVVQSGVPRYDFETPSSFDAGKLVVGENMIRLPLSNMSNAPQTIIGIRQGCTPCCCISAMNDQSLKVEPRATIDYTFKLTVRYAGEFSHTIIIYTGVNELTERSVILRGTAVAPERPARANP